jgi:hypothetical protein
MPTPISNRLSRRALGVAMDKTSAADDAAGVERSRRLACTVEPHHASSAAIALWRASDHCGGDARRAPRRPCRECSAVTTAAESRLEGDHDSTRSGRRLGARNATTTRSGIALADKQCRGCDRTRRARARGVRAPEASTSRRPGTDNQFRSHCRQRRPVKGRFGRTRGTLRKGRLTLRKGQLASSGEVLQTGSFRIFPKSTARAGLLFGKGVPSERRLHNESPCMRAGFGAGVGAFGTVT